MLSAGALPWVIPALDPKIPIYAGSFVMQLVCRRLQEYNLYNPDRYATTTAPTVTTLPACGHGLGSELHVCFASCENLRGNSRQQLPQLGAESVLGTLVSGLLQVQGDRHAAGL